MMIVDHFLVGSLVVIAIVDRAVARELVRPGAARQPGMVRENARCVERLAKELPYPDGLAGVERSKMKNQKEKRILLLGNPSRLI